MDKKAIVQILRRHRASAELTEELLSAFDTFHNPTHESGIDLSATEVISPHSGTSEAKTVFLLTPQQGAVNNSPSDQQASDSYEQIEQLGKGGMGEVWRVRDRTLNRNLAMKILYSKAHFAKVASQRFVDEAQICAQLEHPNIVPIHELGTLPDGRMYFTMKEIKGRTFHEVIKAVHVASENGRWQNSLCGWNLFRLLDAFHQVCRAMAFAHSKGVLHRDLKPTNVMIGEYGEVLVVDWGIAKVLGQAEPTNLSESTKTQECIRAIHHTQMGDIVGTPAYMAPEQAQGDSSVHDARTDVYALGVMLYHLLSGLHPYNGKTVAAVLQKLKSGPPKTLRELKDQTNRLKAHAHQSPQELKKVTLKLPIPEVLIEACDKAMSRKPHERFQSAGALAQVISDWLDGSKQREQAALLLSEAQAALSRKAEIEAEVELLIKEVEAGLTQIPVWASEVDKASLWAKEQSAKDKADEARKLHTEVEQLLLGSLNHSPDFIDAREAIIDHYRTAHELAEVKHDQQAAIRQATRLKRHVDALPKQHKGRTAHLIYLKGTGALSVRTEQADAQIFLEQYVPAHRRLVPKPLAELPQGGVEQYPLEMGSYRLRVTKSGFHEVIYPFSIGRNEHWDSVDPNGAPRPIAMPRLGAIDANSCFVPAGWYWAGGGPEEANVLPRKRIWMDDFLISTYPVTNAQFLTFLNDLLLQGKEQDAIEAVPRTRDGADGTNGQMLYCRASDGRFTLGKDDEGVYWQPEWPVSMITWDSAFAYTEWWAKKTGQNWQLPTEEVWEKAARGADGRAYPWGDDFDPSYCCMHESHESAIAPAKVGTVPTDCSVYGVYGMAGNVHDWTASRWKRDWGSEVAHNSVAYRGGSLFSNRIRCMITARSYLEKGNRYGSLGFRLFRWL